jgi:hypothetical protein
MSTSDINWGGVVVGALFATSIMAISPPVGLTALSIEAKLFGAAIVGGIAGEFLHDLLNRTNAAVTSIGSRG